MATSLNASLNVQLNAASLNASTKQVQQALGRITGQASEFQKSLDASTARVFAFGATTAVINGVTQSFKKLISTTVEVQKKLIEVNSIFQATESTFNKFRDAIFQVAKDTGQSFNTVADGAAELARQGLSAEETAKRLKAALIMTRISGMDAEKSVKALTAAINGFSSAGLTANQIVNKMVAVDTAFAVSTQDLADAFSRAGSTAEDAGVSFDQLLGLVTAVEQKTARGGAVIGNAFKSIFTRLQRGGTIGELQALGVEIDATMGGVQKLKALSNALEGISDPTVTAKIKELAGGVFQINVVSAALKDLSSQTSIYKNAALTASNATNEAFQKNAALSKSIASQINELVVGLTSLAEKVGSVTFGPLIEDLVGIANKFTEFLDKALDPEKGNTFIKGLFKTIGAFLRGPAIVIFTAAFVKIFKLVAKFAGQGLGALFQIGTQTEKIKQIEGGIVGLLSRDEALRNMIVSSTATQAQKEQAIIAAIRTENALLSQQAQLMRGLAMAAASRGVSGFGATGFKGKKGKKFASGYQDEEAMATLLGAKNPKARSTSAQINGRRQSVIYNTEEDIYRGVGRNGDDAIVPRYAGGFVPNFAAVGKLEATKMIKSGNNPTGWNSRTDLHPVTMRRARKNMEARKNKDNKNKKKKKNEEEEVERISLSGKGTAMFVPQLNFKERVDKHEGSFDKGKTKIYYALKEGFNVRGPKIPEGAEAAGDPQDEQLEQNVRQGIVDGAVSYAGTLQPITKKGVGEAEIRKKLSEQGGGEGAIQAAVGVAFEAAILAGLNISPLLQKPKKGKKGGDFDIRGVADDVKRLFYGPEMKDAKGVRLADLKSSNSGGNIASFIKKIANEKYMDDKANMLADLKGEEWPSKGKGKGKGKSNAFGFIPNFAGGLTAAIEREEAAGIPVSKIRAHFDKRGMPKAVTNTDDEPRGLASLGFVPNFARASERRGYGKNPISKVNRQSTYADSNVGPQKAYNKALKSSTSSIKASTVGIKKEGEQRTRGRDASGAAMMSLFALQGVLNLHIAKKEEEMSTEVAALEEKKKAILADNLTWSERQKLLEQNKREIEAMSETTDSMTKLASNASSAATALMTLATLNMLTGGMGGKGLASVAGFGKKGKAAWGAAAAKSGAISKMAKVSAKQPLFTSSFLKPSRAERAGRWAGKMGHKAKAYGLGSKFGGVAGKAAGRLGALGALGMGGFDIYKTQTDKSLNKAQKTERTTKTATKTGATAVGAALGTLIPIPVLGTMLGGYLGAGVGNLLTEGKWKGKGESEADKNRSEREKATGLQVTRESLIGMDEGQFGEAVEENLKQMRKSGMDTTAVQENYNKALEEREKLLTAYTEGDESALGDNPMEKLNASLEKVEAAAVALSGVTHADVDERQKYSQRMKGYESKLTNATWALAEVREKMAKLTGKALGKAKEDETISQDKVQLAGAITGPFSEAVRKANEEDLMMKRINTLDAEKIEADRLLKEKTEEGLGGDDLKPFTDAANKAGQDFIAATKKAGATFLTNIEKAKLAEKENQKKIDELKEQRQAKVLGVATDVAEGKKTDKLDPLYRKIEALSKLMSSSYNPNGEKVTAAERQGIMSLISQIRVDKQGTVLADTPMLRLLKDSFKRLGTTQKTIVTQQKKRSDNEATGAGKPIFKLRGGGETWWDDDNDIGGAGKTWKDFAKDKSGRMVPVMETKEVVTAKDAAFAQKHSKSSPHLSRFLNSPIGAGFLDPLKGDESKEETQKKSKKRRQEMADLQMKMDGFLAGDAETQLQTAQLSLKAQIENTTEVYEDLAKNTKTSGIIDDQRALHEAMQGAATSYGAVKDYVETMTNTTENTATLIETNAKLVLGMQKTQKAQNRVIKSMKKEIVALENSLNG